MPPSPPCKLPLTYAATIAYVSQLPSPYAATVAIVRQLPSPYAAAYTGYRPVDCCNSHKRLQQQYCDLPFSVLNINTPNAGDGRIGGCEKVLWYLISGST